MKIKKKNTVYLGTQKKKKSNVIILYRFIYIFYKWRENAADVSVPFKKPALPGIWPTAQRRCLNPFRGCWVSGYLSL